MTAVTSSLAIRAGSQSVPLDSTSLRRTAYIARSRLLVWKDRRTVERLSGDDLRLNLAPGPNHLDGWVGLDLLPVRPALGMDASRPWPVPSGTAVAINSEHLVEHLDAEQALTFFAEAFRVLRPAGVIRTSTPNLRGLSELLVEADPASLAVHREHGYEAATHGDMVNNYFYMWGHRHIYDFETLPHRLTEAGSTEVEEMPFGRSRHPLLDGIDRHDPDGLERSVLCVDAVKPS
jgi:predicted SAM-dependent methyltransferase